jgi:hypothetical protein
VATSDCEICGGGCCGRNTQMLRHSSDPVAEAVPKAVWAGLVGCIHFVSAQLPIV